MELSRIVAVAALGAGVVIGVSSIYVYFKYTRNLSQDIHHLNKNIEHLYQEIQELKSTKYANTTTAAAKTGKTKRRSSSSNDVFVSPAVSSSGEDNEEYYDVSEESDVHPWATLNGEIPSSTSKEDLSSTYEEIDALLKGDIAEKQQAYDRLIQLRNEYEGNVGVMWRLAMACYQLAIVDGTDDERKKELTFEGLKYATVALACDDCVGESHKWYAAMLGRTTDYVGIQEKIKNGYTFKKHVDEAIKYLPDDHSLYFMKGRWCYEVAMLSWIERKVASTLFATPPTSSLSEARSQFLQVEQIFPKQWKENLLYIAKCYIGEKNYCECINWLEDAINIPCANKEEKEIHEEVLSLLRTYESYRRST